MSPQLEAYIESHIEKEPENLRKLERLTNLQRINGRMCSGHIQGRLLKMFTRMIDPGAVLELGTFTGYSALCIAEGLRSGASLTTVEIEDELEDDLMRTFSESPYGDKIILRIGDALEICKEFPKESLDMVFIDADKRKYPEYYEECKRLIRPGGFILADNTLWDSHVVEADRHDSQTEGVKRFNNLAASDPEMETVIIPVRDGISIIRKRTNQSSLTLF